MTLYTHHLHILNAIIIIHLTERKICILMSLDNAGIRVVFYLKGFVINITHK